MDEFEAWWQGGGCKLATGIDAATYAAYGARNRKAAALAAWQAAKGTAPVEVCETCGQPLPQKELQPA